MEFFDVENGLELEARDLYMEAGDADYPWANNVRKKADLLSEAAELLVSLQSKSDELQGFHDQIVKMTQERKFNTND